MRRIIAISLLAALFTAAAQAGESERRPKRGKTGGIIGAIIGSTIGGGIGLALANATTEDDGTVESAAPVIIWLLGGAIGGFAGYKVGHSFDHEVEKALDEARAELRRSAQARRELAEPPLASLRLTHLEGFERVEVGDVPDPALVATAAMTLSELLPLLRRQAAPGPARTARR